MFAETARLALALVACATFFSIVASLRRIATLVRRLLALQRLPDPGPTVQFSITGPARKPARRLIRPRLVRAMPAPRKPAARPRRTPKGKPLAL